MTFLADVAEWFTAAERWSGANAIPVRLLEHVQLSVTGLVVAVLLAVPPALWLAHRRRAEFLANALVNVGRAVPSFGLIVLAALLFLTWGLPIRFWATVVALVALALPPIFTNTYAGVRSVDPATVESGRGMGLTERQVLAELELPMAAPIILAGIRIAWVQVIATAALGAVVSSGGGFGRYIIDGFAQGRDGYAQVFGGAVLVALLTIVAERVFDLGERLLLPPGVQRLRGAARPVETAGAA